MKNQLIASETRIAVKSGLLNPSQVSSEIKQAYDGLLPQEKLLIQQAATDIRKNVKSYLTASGAVELIAALGMLLVEKGLGHWNVEPQRNDNATD